MEIPDNSRPSTSLFKYRMLAYKHWSLCAHISMSCYLTSVHRKIMFSIYVTPYNTLTRHVTLKSFIYECFTQYTKHCAHALVIKSKWYVYIVDAQSRHLHKLTGICFFIILSLKFFIMNCHFTQFAVKLLYLVGLPITFALYWDIQMLLSMQGLQPLKHVHPCTVHLCLACSIPPFLS